MIEQKLASRAGRDSTVATSIFTPEFDMQNLFSAESLRAAAQLVIVLDQHPIGAGALLMLVGIVGLATWRRR